MKYPTFLGIWFIGATAAQAQDVRPWLFRIEAGAAEIHRASSDGPAGGVRLARVSRNDVLRLEASLVMSGADEGFGIVDVGIELRLCNVRCRVAPYVGGGVGYLGEPEFSGAMFRAGGGIEVTLNANNALRLGVQRATHGGESGPHFITVGLAHRFGSRQ